MITDPIMKTAKTVDEAVQEALEDLQLSREQVDVEIVEENTGGLLGLNKSATVRVIPRELEQVAAEPYVPDLENTTFSNLENTEENEIQE